MAKAEKRPRGRPRLPQGLTLEQVLRATKRSKANFQRLVRDGVVPTLSDGSFDLEQVRAALAENVDHRFNPRPDADEEPSPPRKKREQKAADIALVDGLLASEGMERRDVKRVTLNDVRAAEGIIKTRERALKLAKAEGKLIDVAVVEKQQYEEARRFRELVLNWPARVAPLIAAKLKVQQNMVAVLLENHVRELLAESVRAAGD